MTGGGCACLAPAAVFPNGSTYLLDASTLLVPKGHDIHRYSRSYGSACSPWDSGLAPYCNSAVPPKYCSRAWCYVDPDECDAYSKYPSAFFADLFYSYETCGSTFSEAMEFSRSVSSGELQGKTLRFAYPKESSPWHWKTWNAAEQRYEWDGMMHKFFMRISASAGFQVEERNLSAYSLSKFASNWDACTHDVMQGLIDVCPTGAQQSPNRLLMSHFSAAIMASQMRLMVRKEARVSTLNPFDGYDSMWWEWSKPFTPRLWGAVISLAVTVAWVLAYFEPTDKARAGPRGGMKDNQMSKTGEEQIRTGLTLPPPMVAAQAAGSASSGSSSSSKPPPVCTRIKRFTLQSFFPSLNLAMFGLFVTDVPHSTRSAAGRMIKLGYAFVIVMVMNTYTANLASTLLLRSVSHHGIQSIRDCYAKSTGSNSACTHVCVESQYAQAMAEAHPSVEVLLYPSSKSTFTGLVDGQCQAALVPEHDANARLDFQQDMLTHDFVRVRLRRPRSRSPPAKRAQRDWRLDEPRIGPCLADHRWQPDPHYLCRVAGHQPVGCFVQLPRREALF